MKKKENAFIEGTTTISKAPRFGVLLTRVEKDKSKFSRKEKHKNRISTKEHINE